MSRTRVKRAYKYRFYPTEGQQRELLRTFGCVWLVYNRALQARTEAWDRQQRRVTYNEISALLSRWKKTDALRFLSEVSAVSLQQALRYLQGAFAAFFTQRAGIPVPIPQEVPSVGGVHPLRVHVARRATHVGEDVRAVAHRVIAPAAGGAEPSTVTVSCDSAGRWCVALLVETSTKLLPATNSVVGVDAGIKSLGTLLTGEKVANPRCERRDRARLVRAQRELSRKTKGSNNRPRRAGRWPGSMRGSATAGGIIYTSSPLGSSAKTKRSCLRTSTCAACFKTARWRGRSRMPRRRSFAPCWSARPRGMGVR